MYNQSLGSVIDITSITSTAKWSDGVAGSHNTDRTSIWLSNLGPIVSALREFLFTSLCTIWHGCDPGRTVHYIAPSFPVFATSCNGYIMV